MFKCARNFQLQKWVRKTITLFLGIENEKVVCNVKKETTIVKLMFRIWKSELIILQDETHFQFFREICCYNFITFDLHNFLSKFCITEMGIFFHLENISNGMQIHQTVDSFKNAILSLIFIFQNIFSWKILTDTFQIGKRRIYLDYKDCLKKLVKKHSLTFTLH